MAEIDEAEAGRVVWYSSDEDGTCDVGRSIGLGDGWTLWFGEITNDRHANGGREFAELGDACGTWIILYGPTEGDTKVIGKAVDAYVGEDVLRAIAKAIRPLAPTPASAPGEPAHG